MIREEGNFELTSQTFIGHLNQLLTNRYATSLHLSVGHYVRNPYIESIEILQRYTIAAQEQVIFVGA